ncbi:UNVERIFIED_CONTAM: hypothetical protein Cloal_1707 [Acetivibrio alkalicellulosi]
MLNSLLCINISSSNTKKLVEFYTNILGVPIQFEGYGDYDGAQIGFIKGAPTITIWDENKWGKYVKGSTFVFMTDGLDKTYEELKQKGMELEPPYKAAWGGRELKLQDFEGNNILLLEPME